MIRSLSAALLLLLLVVVSLFVACQAEASDGRHVTVSRLPSAATSRNRLMAHSVTSGPRHRSMSVLSTATAATVDDQKKLLFRIRGGLVGRGSDQQQHQHDEHEDNVALRAEEGEEEPVKVEYEDDEKEEEEEEEDQYQYGGGGGGGVDMHYRKRKQYSGALLGGALLPKLKESSLYQYVSKWWSSTPPLTQAYFASSLFISLYSFCFNGNQWPEILEFDWSKIIFQLQLWRIFTGFLYFGALDIFYPLNFNFVWSQMSSLEKMSYNNPEDFAVMVLYGAALLVGIYTVFNVPMLLLGHNLSMFYAYVWSRVFEGTDVNLFGLITIKAETMPLFFCAQSLVLEQTIPWADVIGIFAGHCYYYMKGKHMLSAPKSWKRLFRQPYWKGRYDKFKNEFE